jgi:hypothetical protein
LFGEAGLLRSRINSVLQNEYKFEHLEKFQKDIRNIISVADNSGEIMMKECSQKLVKIVTEARNLEDFENVLKILAIETTSVFGRPPDLGTKEMNIFRHWIYSGMIPDPGLCYCIFGCKWCTGDIKSQDRLLKKHLFEEHNYVTKNLEIEAFIRLYGWVDLGKCVIEKMICSNEGFMKKVRLSPIFWMYDVYSGI